LFASVDLSQYAGSVTLHPRQDRLRHPGYHSPVAIAVVPSSRPSTSERRSSKRLIILTVAGLAATTAGIPLWFTGGSNTDICSSALQRANHECTSGTVLAVAGFLLVQAGILFALLGGIMVFVRWRQPQHSVRMGSPLPGWYLDSTARLRWWDGLQWTSWVAPDPRSSGEPRPNHPPTL
jgi:hypothetical protein